MLYFEVVFKYEKYENIASKKLISIKEMRFPLQFESKAKKVFANLCISLLIVRLA